MSHPHPSLTPHAAAPTARPGALRRQYVVDARTQFRVAGLLVAGLAALAAIQAAALFTCFVPPADALYDGGQVRALLLKVGVLQFVVTAVLAVGLGVLLSHRFVGAALVLRRAIAGMRTGDHSCRLTLRRTDFLHDVAADLSALRDVMPPVAAQPAAPRTDASEDHPALPTDRARATVA